MDLRKTRKHKKEIQKQEQIQGPKLHRERYLLQSYWSDAPLSLLEKACLTSWVVLGGARVHLYTHDTISALVQQIPVPIRTHIRVLNADLIIARTEKFVYRGAIPKTKRSDAFTALPFSDLFRYEMLRKKGGIWMDMDILMLRPIPARMLAQPYFFVSERTMQAGAYKSKELQKPTNACIGARDPHSSWAEWIHARVSSLSVDSAWTFMKLFQQSLSELQLESYVEPPEFVMPVNWWDLDGLFLPKEKVGPSGCLKEKYGVKSTCASFRANKHTIGVHFFRGLLRKRDLPYEDRTQIPADSFMGILLHQVEKAAGFELTE
jgi:hypothetical protein